MEWVLLPCYSLSSKGHESEYVRVIGPPAGCISNITNGSIGAGCSSSIMDRGSSTPLISFLKKQVVKPIWKTNHHISPPARWRSIDFNKGATPSSLPSFLPSLLSSSAVLLLVPACRHCGHVESPALSSEVILPQKLIASSSSVWAHTDPNTCQKECQIGCRHMSDRMPDRMSEYTSDRMPNWMSEYMSDRMPNVMSDYMSDRMPGRKSKLNTCQNIYIYISDRMSEYKSDRMLEKMPECPNMCQIEYQSVWGRSLEEIKSISSF